MDDTTNQLVVHGFASQVQHKRYLGQYFNTNIIAKRRLVSAISLHSAQIPHTWPFCHPRLNNTKLYVHFYKQTFPTAEFFSIITLSPPATGFVTIEELRADLELQMNNAVSGSPFTVTYNADALSFTVTSSGGVYVFAFVRIPVGDPLFIENRGLEMIGYLNKAVDLNLSTIADLHTSWTGGVVDLQPIKAILISIQGIGANVDSDVRPVNASFVIPVRSNYGEYLSYVPESEFRNFAFSEGSAFDIANLKIDIFDSLGQEIPFNGGEFVLILNTRSGREKHTKMNIY